MPDKKEQINENLNLHPLTRTKEFKLLLKSIDKRPFDLYYSNRSLNRNQFVISKIFLEKKIYRCGRKKLNALLKTFLDNELIDLEKYGHNYIITIYNYCILQNKNLIKLRIRDVSNNEIVDTMIYNLN